MSGRRDGSSLIETVAVLSLSSFVMAVIGGICLAQMRLARATADQVADAEAVRTVTQALAGEARRMTAADVRTFSADSLVVRAFRGTGIPCGGAAAAALVRYMGDRLPDPAKDSVLVVGPASEAAVPLLDSAPAPGQCPALPGEAVLLWRTGGTLPPGSVVLLFESGSYHLATRALRYRTGAGGRQPLTAEALHHPYTRFTGVAADAVSFRIEAGGRRSEHLAPFGAGPLEP
jgi:hypothetical protein